MNRQLRSEGAIFSGGSYGEKPGSYGDREILKGAMVINSRVMVILGADATLVGTVAASGNPVVPSQHDQLITMEKCIPPCTVTNHLGCPDNLSGFALSTSSLDNLSGQSGPIKAAFKECDATVVNDDGEVREIDVLCVFSV